MSLMKFVMKKMKQDYMFLRGRIKVASSTHLNKSCYCSYGQYVIH